MTYLLIFISLLAIELTYFRIADKCNIIDRPNDRSSHSTIVLRGGGIIFVFSLWLWATFFGLYYQWFIVAVTIIACVSFIDDIRSLPDSVRLIAQFAAMFLMLYQLNILQIDLWWIVVISLIVCVGATNIINFMDGINGITGGYSMVSLISIFLINKHLGVVEESLVVTIIIADIVFCFFNFRPKGKAKCFAGDVGSIGIAFILLFLIGRLVLYTCDVTYLILIIVYGVDGCLTICHRIMLHEHIGEAHRKHAYQLMANELRIGHVKVSLLYMAIQLTISYGYIYICPNTIMAHWLYFLSTLTILSLAYIVFIKKYYYLHKDYLASLKK